MMYSTCIHCTRDLGRNAMVETLPIGRRLAFDAGKGRLWVVCSSCGKWNLVPFDTRLESIDACERLFRDTRTRYSTDNIGMAKVGDGLTLVRVGKALRPEFASWRYGEQYRKRRRVAVGAGIVVAGAGMVAAISAAVALPLAVGFTASSGVGGIAYWAGHWSYHSFIGRKSRVRTIEPGSDSSLTISMAALKLSRITWLDSDPPALLVPCKPGSPRHGYHRWEGAGLATMGRRVAGGLNLTTGSTKEIAAAVTHLSHESGDLSRWVRQEATAQRYRSRANITTPETGWELEAQSTVLISDLKPEHRLALEMWFSEDIERRWMEGELRMLEREWRDAERLAKIADDLVLEAEPAREGL